MPRLLSLEMQGFKSFANRTKIVFPDGLVVIIGPNGSGKSNISDAICFVLGKRSKKEMRTEKLSHLIFNGGKSGKPAEFARVMLSLDNSKKEFPYEGKVFSVSRTVDKDGTSTYRINGKRCTLSEVQNALRGANINPDGMNIVIQGEIARFVDMSTTEKRTIIEDIAGISVYEEKKKKAISELENVGSRTNEGRIVLAEKKKYLDELKLEKGQAERFLRKKDSVKALKGSLLLKQMKDIKSNVTKVDSNLEIEAKQIEKWGLKVEGEANEIDKLKKDVEALTKEIEEGGESEQVKLGKEIQKIQDRLSELRSTVKNHTEEIKKIEVRDLEIKKNIEENRDSMAVMNSEKMRFEARLDDIQSDVEEKKSLLESRNRSDYLVLKEKLIGVERELFVKEAKLEGYGELKKHEIRLEELRDEKVGKERKISGLEDALKELESKISHHIKKLKEVEDYLIHLEREAVRISERSRSARLGDARKVCSAGIKCVHGILSDLFEIREHEKAVLSFAGQLIEAVVTDDLNVAGKISGFVKGNGLGEVLVLPISEMRNKGDVLKKGSNLIECISFEERYKKLFETVFSGVIVKSLSSGSDCATVDGDSLKEGVVRCGGKYDDGEKMAARIEKDQSRYTLYRNNLKADIEQIKSETEGVKINIIEKKRDLKDISKEMEYLDSSLRGVSAEKMANLKKEISELNRRKRSIEKKMEGCDVVSEEFLRGLKSGLEALEEEDKVIGREIISLESKIENVLVRDLKNFESIRRSLESDAKRFGKELEGAKKEIESQNKILEKKQVEFRKLYSKLRERFSKRGKLKDKIADLEKSNALMEQRINGAKKRMMDLKVKRAEFLAVLEGMKERFKVYGEATDVRKSVGELESEIRSSERELTKFGPVNMKALETFRDVESEYTNLDGKVKKLDDETAEIYRMIDEIESRKNQSFISCFRKINRNFGKIFEVLSPGGKGKLILENDESPLEGGVDFVVKPFGKKLSSLKQLSGGEKTIVTLAFIFSIQEYEAAPFYIFDEIDAALDKTNSEKLGELVNDYTKNAQFIIISHNDELVGNADYLYGVSMKPSGISQIVSIKLKE
jgi:chromosome segregation protein